MTARKDSRLYARFSLDFPDSPKIAPLSDGAFRALVEMTCYSRRMLTDGFLDERIISKLWKPKVVSELTQNDPKRPSLIVVEGGFQIHDFAEHQQTKADIEAKREAGSLGGIAAKKARESRSKEVAPATDLLQQNDSTSRSKGGAITETESKTLSSTKRESASRGSRIPRNFTITDEMRAWAAVEAPLVDLDKKLPEFIDYWAGVAGEKGVKLDWVSTWRNGMRKQQQFALRDAPANAAPYAGRKIIRGGQVVSGG